MGTIGNHNPPPNTLTHTHKYIHTLMHLYNPYLWLAILNYTRCRQREPLCLKAFTPVDYTMTWLFSAARLVHTQ